MIRTWLGRLALITWLAGPIGLAAPGGDALGQVYPVRPIKLVVPFAPGGAADLTGRLIAERLSGQLGQQVVVENLPGRGGTLASQAVAQAAPDGYTLLFVTNSTLVISPIFLRTPGYDPLASFEPVSMVGWMPAVIAAKPSLPVRDLPELIALCKAAPGKYRYVNSGLGSYSSLLAEMFKAQTQADMKDVPRKGPADGVRALIAGEVDVMFDAAVFFTGPARKDEVRPLAVMGYSRMAEFPGVPTTAEAGFAELVGYTWNGIVAPVRTPPEIVDALNRPLQGVLSEIETQATFIRYGLRAEGGTPEEFRRFIAAELRRWSRALPLSATEIGK